MDSGTVEDLCPEEWTDVSLPQLEFLIYLLVSRWKFRSEAKSSVNVGNQKWNHGVNSLIKGWSPRREAEVISGRTQQYHQRRRLTFMKSSIMKSSAIRRVWCSREFLYPIKQLWLETIRRWIDSRWGSIIPTRLLPDPGSTLSLPFSLCLHRRHVKTAISCYGLICGIAAVINRVFTRRRTIPIF